MKTIITFSFTLLMPILVFSQEFSRIQLSNDQGNYFITSTTVMNGEFYFTGNIPPYNLQTIGLWKTNGITGGSEFIFPFTSEVQNASVEIFSHNNIIYIKGRHLHDFDNSTEPYGVELWVSDGTAAGTQLLKDIIPGQSHSWPGHFTAAGNVVYFHAEDMARDFYLWKTDGTENGTIKVSIDKIAEAKSVYDGQGTVYFSGYDNTNSYQLWKTDGTQQGTQLVKVINANTSSAISNFIVFNDLIFFTADNGTHGEELWVTDGTEQGTQMIKDIHPGSNGSVQHYDYWAVVLENELIFTADNGTNGTELWKTDGTEAGTMMVKDINPGEGPSIRSNLVRPVIYQGNVYFIANISAFDSELWKTNGTEAGTVIVKDIFDGTNGSNINRIVLVNDRLYFGARTSFDGFKLYESDGTAEGTYVIAPVDATNEFPISAYFDGVEYNNALLFTANFTGNSSVLWRYTRQTTSIMSVLENTFHLYPNPATNHLRLDLGKIYSHVTIEIHNINGRLIERIKLQSVQPHDLNVSQWSNGLYVISVISEEGVVNRKFIKQ